jgi:hypothetical protein
VRTPLRRVLAGRLIDAGCSVRPDDVVISTGGQEALNLSLRAVASTGDTVLVESPTCFGRLEVLSSQGLRAVEVQTHPVVGQDLDADHALDDHLVGVDGEDPGRGRDHAAHAVRAAELGARDVGAAAAAQEEERSEGCEAT